MRWPRGRGLGQRHLAGLLQGDSELLVVQRGVQAVEAQKLLAVSLEGSVG